MSGETAEERIRQLQALIAELTVREQDARRRWAIHLHDELAQILVVCKMRLTRLRDHSDEKGAQLIQETTESIDTAIQLTRGLMTELSPVSLYDGGLSAAIRALAVQLQRDGFTLHVSDHGFPANFTSRTNVLLFHSMYALVDNVLKHADVREAEVRIRNDGHVLHIQVSDAGCGFDPAEGTAGHGIITAREWLAACDATLSIVSQPGAGTQAEIQVRLETAAGEPHQVQQPDNAAEAAPRFADKVRLLVADDHALVREGLRRMIKTLADIDLVGEAVNGEEAVELALQLKPDAILMDINMPRMTGIEATRVIKQEAPSTVIIGLTLHDDEDILEAFREAGASECLTKGGRADELHEVLLDALKRR